MTLSCSGRSIIPAIIFFEDVPHCDWCNGRDVCYDPKEFLDGSGYYDSEEAEYNDDQYRYLLEEFADDAVGSSLRCE